MLKQAKGYFGTLIFAHVGVAVLHFALQASAIYNWLSSNAFLYWLVYGILAIGFLFITAQESINQGGRDAQELQGCIDRGEDEAAQRKAYRPFYGVIYALVLEVPVILLSLLSGLLEGLPGILVGLVPNLWYAAWQPVKDIAPHLFPVLYLAIGALTVAVAALTYPDGRRRYNLMRQHMLENTERLRNHQKAIRIPRGKEKSARTAVRASDEKRIGIALQDLPRRFARPSGESKRMGIASKDLRRRYDRPKRRRIEGYAVSMGKFRQTIPLFPLESCNLSSVQ